MDIITPAERTLTQSDHLRLTRLLARSGAIAGFEAMRDMLDLSDLVDPAELPPTVVTMGTRVLLEGQGGSEPLELTVCYPEEANATLGCVSVLSPVGLALLGRRAGEAARWRLPDGWPRRPRTSPGCPSWAIAPTGPRRATYASWPWTCADGCPRTARAWSPSSARSTGSPRSSSR